jgi:hypothetical protein
MKSPDSRPRFQSAKRHYHRYREQQQGGWNDWVDGGKRPKRGRSPRQRILMAVAAALLGLIALLGAAFFSRI